MFRRKRNAFTLVELMVAIAISVIVMFFIGTFITDSLTEI
jgi:prepilin-type N-terminal cleavage/methylation domain-containing protein